MKTRKIFIWSFVSLIFLIIIGIMIVPPMITLNKYKNQLETFVMEQTGTKIKINGNINVSLLGHATIVAHNVKITNGNIGKMSFSIPVYDIFNINNAKINRDISISNANFNISNIVPLKIKHKINIYNSDITFMNKKYQIIRATLYNQDFIGQIRTSQHKYDIEFTNGEFSIKNYNYKININGELYPDGSAHGNMEISTKDINKWFEFNEPQIKEHINLSMDFDWDGEYGFDFKNIHANDFYGNIKLFPNGYRYIELKSNNVNYDLSFLLTKNKLFYNTDINIDFYGNMQIGNKQISHILINTYGSGNDIKINKLSTDDMEIFDGIINSSGLHNAEINFLNFDEPTTCIFSGTATKWECSEFTYGDTTGKIHVDNKKYKIIASSNKKMPQLYEIKKLASLLGESGEIQFTFQNASGTIYLTPQKTDTIYNFAQNATLHDLNIDLKFLPKFMLNAHGSFTLDGTKKTFIPYNKKWTFVSNGNEFHITGENIKDLIPNINMNFIRDLPYVLSGSYNNENIDELNIMIADMILSGNANKNEITIKTDSINLDSIINSEYFDNFEEQKFLTNHPIATLFKIPTNISLSCNELIYNKKTYKNFIYSLKPENQIFSISDNEYGNMLVIIEKNKSEYDVSVQLNKFKLNGPILNYDTPLNIHNSIITAEMNLHTYGQIAYDLLYNLSGDIDLSFYGGTISGFGFDKFYASYEDINSLNAEYAISSALETGISKIKNIKIKGVYENGNFITSHPITMSLYNVDAVGKIEIQDKKMSGIFSLLMRGISPNPENIEVTITPNGSRKYALSEIMRGFDSGFMRAYIRTHNKQ